MSRNHPFEGPEVFDDDSFEYLFDKVPGFVKWLAEHDRQVAERAWAAALNHVWELNDPLWALYTFKTKDRGVVTEFGIKKAQQENPYRASDVAEEK